jgi:hypothetical protein
MAQSKSTSVHKKKFDLPELLALHLRWMIVLAKLKELDLNDTIAKIESLLGRSGSNQRGKKTRDSLIQQQAVKRNVAELVRQMELEVLFMDVAHVEISADGLGQWFGIKEEGKSGQKTEGATRGIDKSSPFSTIYQCRNFYALDAPNNLVQRLSKMLGAAMSEFGFDADADKGSKHDQYIRQWGEYARKLVQVNGGWDSFISARSLDNVQDFWPGAHPEVNEKCGYASHHNALIQRILFLERDRYIQILTSTVAIHWPLWFLKSLERRETLKAAITFLEKDKNVYTGKPLPENELFIDINVCVGQLEGLPYPFGIADDLLAVGDEETEMKYRFFGSPWPSSALTHISCKLQQEFWNPPLLFAARSDSFSPTTKASENYTIPLMEIAEKSKNFFNLYVTQESYKNKDDDKWLSDLSVATEPGTYADKSVENLMRDRKLRKTPKFFSRLDMAKDFSDVEGVDVVISYPPVDTLIQSTGNFVKVTGNFIYETFRDYSQYFPQAFSSSFLCTGLFIVGQPKTAELLLDTCNYLRKVEVLFLCLMPEMVSLKSDFLNLHVSQPRYKKDSARMISRFCQVLASRNPLVENKIVNSDSVEEWMKDIGYDMASVLFRECQEDREKFIQAWNDWGWAVQLEFLQHTSVYLSCDLY